MFRFSKKIQLLLFTAVLALLTVTPAYSQKTIQFSGYEWEVRPNESRGGPGPNRWSAENVWLDAEGKLHLKLTHRDGKWECAEVYTTQRFGFGVYQFQIEGRVDRLDPNVVFGLFTYPEPETGPDGTHEIDIEFARWGRENPGICNYTVFPAIAGLKDATRAYPAMLHDDGLSTQRFTWTRDRILFQSLYGHTDGNTGEFAIWLYQPREPLKHISQKMMPVHINLWCFEGRPPKDGKEVEVVVTAFKFTAKLQGSVPRIQN